jgi:hypothetical protein
MRRARADNRCDSGEDPTDLLGIDIEIACHSKVHQIRKDGFADRW